MQAGRWVTFLRVFHHRVVLGPVKGAFGAAAFLGILWLLHGPLATGPAAAVVAAYGILGALSAWDWSRLARRTE